MENLIIKKLKLNCFSSSSNPMKSMEIPGMPSGTMGMINLGEIFGKGFGQKKEKEN